MKQLLFILFIISYCLYACHNNRKEEKNTVMDTDTINKMLERKGKNIFLRDCGACHGGKEKTDNYLAGVVQRVGKNYLGRFITNQDSLVSIKDHYAMKMKEEYVNLANSHNFKYSPDTLAGIIEDLK